jgi:DNA-binding NarL/FixJ family response regulator
MGATVVIADAHRLVREGLRALIAKHGHFEVVGDAEDGVAAAELVLAKQPDVAVIGLQLPGLSGIEVVRCIRRALPRCRCVLLLTRQSPDQVGAALRAGVTGLVDMSSGFDELLEAIECARLGRRYLARSLGGCIAQALGEMTDERTHERLTGRQREVLRLIAEGRSTREIAGRIGISYKTAQTHRAKLMARLGIHKVSSLVRYAIREGIVAE